MNFEGTARTNYFRVKNLQTFAAFVARYSGLTIVQEGNPLTHFPPKPARVCVLVEDTDGGTFPTDWTDDQGVQHDGELFVDGVSGFLMKGQVAVFMEIGHEGLRSLSGLALAVDWRGNFCSVDLDEIFVKAARHFGVKRTKIGRAYY